MVSLRMLRPSLLRVAAPLQHSPARRIMFSRGLLTSPASTLAPPATMLAHRHLPESNELVRQRVPVPVPQTGEVLLRVAAAGLCHSDASTHFLFLMNPRVTLLIEF